MNGFNMEFQRVAEMLAEARRPIGAEFQRVAETVAQAQRPEFQRVAELTLSILRTRLLVSEKATTAGSLGGVAVAEEEVPLLPGLANPWQQVRAWELAEWLAFVGFILSVVSFVLALRAPAGLTDADVEEIVIRTVREVARTEPAAPCVTPTTTAISSSHTNSSNSREHDEPAGRPPPSSRVQ